MSLTPAQIKSKSFESTRNSFSFSFLTRGGCVSCLRACLGARLLPQSYQYPNMLGVCSMTTLRASLSGTFLLKEGCRKPVLGVCSMTSRYTQLLQNESVVCSGSPFTTTNNDFYTALYPANIYELAALYIINIKIGLTTKKVQVL